jgi:hypothetical protein
MLIDCGILDEDRIAKAITTSKVRRSSSKTTAPNKLPEPPKKRGNATAPNMLPGQQSKKIRVTKASTSENHRKANLRKPMNGTAHLNPNAEKDFIKHCANAKKLVNEVSNLRIKLLHAIALILFLSN